MSKWHAWYSNGTSNGIESYFEYAGEYDTESEALSADIGYGVAVSQDRDAVRDGRCVSGKAVTVKNVGRGRYLGPA